MSDEVTVTINGTAVSLQEAVNQATEALGRLRQATQETEEQGSSLGNAFGMFGEGAAGIMSGFGGIIEDVVGKLGQFALGQAQVFAGMIAWQAFNDAADAVRNFAGALFELNVQTEQNVNSWRYTYGTGMDPTAAVANAHDIAQWTSTFAYNIPFTRQDLMTSISQAAPLGLDLQGLQNYYPIFADLAATHTDQQGNPLTLEKTIMAIRGAEMGYSRMLRYDLNIDPKMLEKYGLQEDASGHITDMTTLLPSLEAYSKAQGWTNINAQGQDQGAAYNAAHNTWWGELSSFTDRIQNMELSAGGTNLDGTIRKGSFFAVIKQDLDGISGWVDNHQGQMQQITDWAGTKLGDATTLAGKGLQGLAQGISDALTKTPQGKQVLSDIESAGQWLADPKNQKAVEDFATAVGTNLVGALVKADNSFKDLKHGWDDLNKALGGKAGSDIFQGLVDAITFLPAQIGRGLSVIGDLVNLLRDIKHGDWDKASSDYVKLGYDMMNSATFGASGEAISQAVSDANAPATSSGSVAVDSNGNAIPGTQSSSSGVPVGKGAAVGFNGGGSGGAGTSGSNPVPVPVPTPSSGGGAGGGGGGGHITSYYQSLVPRQVADTLFPGVSGGGSWGSLPLAPISTTTTTNQSTITNNITIHRPSDDQIQRVVDAVLTQRDSDSGTVTRQPGNFPGHAIGFMF